MEQREIEALIDHAVQRAVKAERAEAEERESKKAYNLTFRYLKQYSDLISSLQNETVEDAEESTKESTFLSLLKKSQIPTAVIVANIHRCLVELEKEQTQKGQSQKYEVFKLYFFEKLTYEQIIERIPMGDSTPRRWVSEMVSILSVKLFGVTAIRK